MRRDLPAACFLFEKPPFGMPVGQRKAQTWQIRIAGEDLGFDGRDLPLAAFDWVAVHSRCRSCTLQRNFVERVAAF